MKKIIIDSGHGGHDAGACSFGQKEKVLNLEVTKFIVEELNKYECQVLTTRSDDTFKTLQERSNFANKEKADIFISIHCNSFNNAGTNGLEVFYYHDDKLAKCIYEKLKGTNLYKSHRGVKKGDYHVLRETKCNAALVEMGFISNYNEMYMITTNKRRIATSIVEGIVSHLNLSLKAEKLYRVYVGSFKYKNNANDLVARLKQDGYEPFVKYE